MCVCDRLDIGFIVYLCYFICLLNRVFELIVVFVLQFGFWELIGVCVCVIDCRTGRHQQVRNQADEHDHCA